MRKVYIVCRHLAVVICAKDLGAYRVDTVTIGLEIFHCTLINYNKKVLFVPRTVVLNERPNIVHNHLLTLTVLVTTIDALGHF